MSGNQQKFYPRNRSFLNESAFSNESRNPVRATPPRVPPEGDEKVPRGRKLFRPPSAPSGNTSKRNAPRTNPETVIISSDESGHASCVEVRPPKRRRRNDSTQARRYRESATRARLPPHKFPPRQVRRLEINKMVVSLTSQLHQADRSDRSNQDVGQWCTERSNASTAVTKFIGKYYLDMNLIRSPERLKFAEACVNCLKLYCGNRPTFDVADAMWRMLRALELDLEMAKACGIDTLFEHWHGKKMYCHHVQGIAVEVEKRLTNMRCVLLGEGNG